MKAQTHSQHTTKEEVVKFDEDKYHSKIKYGPLDIPYHWAQVMKIVDAVEDSRSRWILHQLFALELTQALHYNFFKQNSRSSYNFLTIKELFLEDEVNKNKIVADSSIEKLETFSQIPNNMLCISALTQMNPIMSAMQMTCKTECAPD